MERENLHSSDDSSSLYYSTISLLVMYRPVVHHLVPVRVCLFSTVLSSDITRVQEDLELSSFFKFLDRTRTKNPFQLCVGNKSPAST